MKFYYTYYLHGNESNITSLTWQEYLWAIGTSVGETDIQNYTSTGHNVAGINSSLEGVLQHNHTYYISIICYNGAGQSAAHNDTKGTLSDYQAFSIY